MNETVLTLIFLSNFIEGIGCLINASLSCLNYGSCLNTGGCDCHFGYGGIRCENCKSRFEFLFIIFIITRPN